MPVNADKAHLWKSDTRRSVDHDNGWYMRFAPETYRSQRVQVTEQAKSALERTSNLASMSPELLRGDPAILPTLRMTTVPPLARDRLIELADLPTVMVKSTEEGQLPPRMVDESLDASLKKLAAILTGLVDEGIFLWVGERKDPSDVEARRVAMVMVDRLCGAQSNPIIRNAQEQRYLAAIEQWLEERGYPDTA